MANSPFSPAAPALLADMYQLTMACGYWKAGLAGREAVFHLFFREHPFHGGFTIACGLGDCVKYMRDFRFDGDGLAYLAGLRGSDGRPLFASEFLEHLRDLRLNLDLDAVPEGSAVFPHEPLLRVRGPMLQAQIVETALLNIVNFQSLIATKAARICLAAQGDDVVEFGLRRAQGVAGALTASRAAFIGGCAATSNLLAGQLFGIPVRGTHAHSWVMSFDSELAAFNASADAMPNNAFFLVDTYNTLEGVRHAVEAGRRLAKAGHRFGGIRLDSGDLAYLSIEARKILDAGGFPDAKIIASNDLDEHLIASLKQQGAAIDAWGVGTKLVTAYDQPALGGVYKLSALQDAGGAWQRKIKISEQAAKATNPGILQVRRFEDGAEFIADAIFDELSPAPGQFTIVDPLDVTRRKHVPAGAKWHDLLAPVLRRGEPVEDQPALEAIRQRVKDQLARLHPGIKRFEHPHQYPAGLELGLHDLKTQMILAAKG
ncbi:MAG TPA: nicotinate phosphoribosyltransferase [Verrucomicrobiae bacterium]|jgi:nicotinate phosphoribosyltransferase